MSGIYQYPATARPGRTQQTRCLFSPSAPTIAGTDGPLAITGNLYIGGYASVGVAIPKIATVGFNGDAFLLAKWTGSTNVVLQASVSPFISFLDGKINIDLK